MPAIVGPPTRGVSPGVSQEPGGSQGARLRRRRLSGAAEGRRLDRGGDPEQRHERRRPFPFGRRWAGHHAAQTGGTALRQSEETLRVFLDAVPAPAFLLDRDGTILASNRALARSLGLPEGELVGQYAFGLIPPKLADTGKRCSTRSSAPGNRLAMRTCAAGRHFLNFESPVLDAAGNVTRVAVFALDITERKRRNRPWPDRRRSTERSSNSARTASCWRTPTATSSTSTRPFVGRLDIPVRSCCSRMSGVSCPRKTRARWKRIWPPCERPGAGT